MAELPDLTDFLKEGAGVSINDVSWLAVDEAEYRQTDVLPKQNLDTTPDLAHMWDHNRDASPLRLIPNSEPHTMGDLSQAHGRLRVAPEVLVRTARLAIMQYNDPARIREALTSRYDADSIKAASEDLKQVFAERGLLGRLYIAAEDFPSCAQGGPSAEFARKNAPSAQYLLAKKACGSCMHHKMQADGSHHCGVFHKEIQVEVPYTKELADKVENLQRANGMVVQASTASPKDRIKAAFLAERPKVAGQFSGQQQYVPPSTVTPETAQTGLISAQDLVKKKREAESLKTAELKARPIIAFLRREMIKGRSAEEVIGSLRLSFDLTDLQSTASQWKPVIEQLGLYGVVYSTQDSFDECREGADLLARHGSNIKAIVAGSKCGSCIFSQVGRCMMYGRKLVASPNDIFTSEVVKQVVDEHRIAGRLPYNADRLDWGKTPVAALKAIHKAASGPQVAQGASARLAIEKQFTGMSHGFRASELSIRSIVTAASKFMNEGLYGEDLASTLKSRFDPRDLVAAKGELQKVFAEQGLQGIKYIDPTIYDDYGRGCKEAGRLHRSRLVPYVKAGSKCGSCVLKSPTGECSVLAKKLVVEPPYIDKAAEQRAILASGKATEVSYESLMNNGLTMMAEYELQHQASSDVDMTPRTSAGVSIEFGGINIDL